MTAPGSDHAVSGKAQQVGPVSKRGWQRKFDEPVPLPGGRKLVTLP